MLDKILDQLIKVLVISAAVIAVILIASGIVGMNQKTGQSWMDAVRVRLPEPETAEVAVESSSEVLVAETEPPATSAAVAEQTTEPEPTAAAVQVGDASTTVHLICVGDNMAHRSVSYSGLQADGTWNYDANFKMIAPYLERADIAIINQEAVIGGNWIGPRDYPSFNARTEVVDAEIKAGFDVILAANNHILDQGVDCLTHMQRYFADTYPNIPLLGVHSSWETRDAITVYEEQGIRIAMINYTDILNSKADYNGREYLVDYLNPVTGEGYERLERLIVSAKQQADFVIVFPHWGTEYKLDPDEHQKQEVKFLADHGVDLVIGMHPHVPEPIDYIDRPDGGKMLVFYSLGNYQSIQSKESTCLEEMAKVAITKRGTQTYISDFDVEFMANYFELSHELIGVIDYYNIVRTYPMELYTREMAQANWVHFDNQDFDDNAFFNLYERFAAQVADVRKNAGMPRK